VWRIRDNQELRESYKNLAFVADKNIGMVGAYD
jgi:hypothetical protein